MMQGYGYGYGPMGGGGFGILAAIFWLLVIAGVVVLIVWGIRQLSGSGHGHRAAGPGTAAGQPGGQDEACEIARVRYAKGEITREQYAEICHGLGVPGPPPLQPPVAYGQPPQAPAAPPAQPPHYPPPPPPGQVPPA
jgi:putative membrane protein